MKKQKIEDIFSSLEDFSSVPPPELWAGIEEKLDKPKKKKRVILWWSAAACLLLCLSLPAVLSDSGNKIGNGTSVEKNNVVLDENQNGENQAKPTSTEDQNSENNKEGILKPNSENATKATNNSIVNQTKETAVAENNSENENASKTPLSKSNVSKSNIINSNTNQAVAEGKTAEEKNDQFSVSRNQKTNSEKQISNQAVAVKHYNSAKENRFNSAEKYQLNTSETQKLNAEKSNSNQAVAVKNYDSEKQNGFNSAGKNQLNTLENQKLNTEKSNSNQAVAVKNYNSEKQNRFNSAEKNQFNTSENKKSNNEKGNSNQAIAFKNYTSGKQNGFTSAGKNQFSENEKRNLDKVLAEKTFTSKTTNSFNTTSKNQLPNSVFESNLNSNANNVALNPSKTNSTERKPNMLSENKKETLDKTQKSENVIAENIQKNNLKNNAVLSKQDSVQFAELQIMQDALATFLVDRKKEKKPKTASSGEKWAVEVFAGVASSENYKNDKTLGNVNDSKQSNSYGVKTKYKLNKKWAVGSGFKINELGQSVANVSYISTKNNAFLGTSDYLIQNATVPQIATNESYVLVSNTTRNALNSNNIQSGNLDQSLKYIEMPLEVSYAVFSKNKASISLNTGGFVGKLIGNSIAIDGNSIGENANANSFVYGPTLSSTVQYRVYKKTNIFVEPAMNYYMNPLSSQSFNQFQWGLNFGLNVSF
ncbi:hypothetical protein SAMN06265349_10560 [Flavobacterium resistens]|uniref:Outer membrane protein beta-barrel domain-containing protein n=1 Tax=Flavobacterium resistens TaxID=443612 RepID=A0A521EL10_9FLAO|nr:hypothetical protein [Flavobacterium resistens]MRX67690.1 hypothetical protein [Flavobacterium resistens]SMO84572.1 hypothetical protein SAMN06265349_10560 [Flavobacterium resistens]